jgi:mono/diheme cytochrome c family protein
MNHKIKIAAFASTLALALLTASADEKPLDPSKLPPAATTPGVTYDKDIKPIFQNACIKCHGEKKAASKLRLDSLDAAIKGGKEGPDIVPGKSGQSPLVYAIAHVGDDDDDFMPKGKKGEPPPPPLTADQIGLIRAWIDQGAK